MKANRTVVGVDTAKRVFQLHWVELETGELVDLRLTRAKFLEHFANRASISRRGDVLSYGSASYRVFVSHSLKMAYYALAGHDSLVHSHFSIGNPRDHLSRLRTDLHRHRLNADSRSASGNDLQFSRIL